MAGARPWTHFGWAEEEEAVAHTGAGGEWVGPKPSAQRKEDLSPNLGMLVQERRVMAGLWSTVWGL